MRRDFEAVSAGAKPLGGNLSGAPMTYELDGRQFVVTPVGGWLYAWVLPERATRVR